MTKTELRTYYDTALPVVQRWLYLVPFVVLLIYQQMLWSGIPLFGRPLPEYVDHVEFFAMNLLMFRVFFFQKMSIKQAIIVGFMTILVYISSLRADNRTVLLAWTFIIAAKDQDFEELVRVAFWILLTTSMLLIGLYFAGVIEDATSLRWYPDKDPLIRHSIGFPHPNSLGIAVLHIYACLLFLKRKSIRLWVPFMGLLATVFVYTVPNSVSSCGCLLLLTLLSLLCAFPLPAKIRYWLCWIAAGAVLGFNLFSVAYSLHMDALPLAEKLNLAFNYRFSSAFSIYKSFGISSCGTILPEMYNWCWLENGDPFYMPWLDASYMDLMLRYGLLIYLVYSGLYAAAAFRIRKTGNLMLLGILAVYAAHGIMENSLYILRFSIFPIAMAAALYGTSSTVAKAKVLHK